MVGMGTSVIKIILILGVVLFIIYMLLKKRENEKLKQITTIIIGIILVVLGISLFLVSTNTNKPIESITNSETALSTATNSVSDTVVIRCARNEVSELLRSSSTAQWGTSQIIDEDDYGRYLVYVPLEAQNGFGGYNKLYYLVIVKDVEKDGHYIAYYNSTLEIPNLRGLSTPSILSDYEEGVVAPIIEEFLESNKWGQGENTNMVNESNPVATMEIEDYGTVKIELYPDEAPNTVKNFIALANNKFYDNLTFHRIVKGFMIQGGGKNGAGAGNPLLSDILDDVIQDKEYAIAGEFQANGYDNKILHKEGVISMARWDYSGIDSSLIDEGYNSAGSQFFIMTQDNSNLDGFYASFGKVIEGMEIIHKIEDTEVESVGYNEGKPIKAPIIKSIRVDTFGIDYDLPVTIDTFDLDSYRQN